MGCMTKMQFLLSLHDKLTGLPRDEVEQRLNFYSEMIEDRMEEGLSEADAVAAAGSIDDIASQIKADIPLAKIVKEKIKPRKNRKGWQIALLAVGGLVWVPLLIAAAAVVVSLYVSVWALIASLWGVFAALVVCAFAVTVFGIAFAFSGNVYTGLAAMAAGMVCAGLGIFLFFGCREATKGAAWLTKKMVLAIKKIL
ncbi:MAG: DUF1700 domain-containing protein [Ruminococcaceae bacterium]|nr:DUF1700 domain-containing protein [Oscillospiraceae bacterium]